MLNLDLRFDQPDLPVRDDCVRHLVARITPPPPDPGRVLPPLDLAIVIDASGSMAGAPLDAAKEATLRLARDLPSTTRLTVVSFADNVVVHADGTTLDRRGRDDLGASVASIEIRGCTNLHSGWTTACALLGAEGAAAGGRRRHVVVLSDGMANQGIVDPVELGVAASRENERGIPTSCIGIGDDYSPVQLTALAEHGGGECHDAEDAREIVEVLTGSMLELAEIVAENVQVVVDVPDGVGARELTGMPAGFDGSRISVSCGALRGGVQRAVVLRLEVPAGIESAMAHGAVEVTGRVRWRAPGADETSEGPTVGARADRRREPAEKPTLDDARAVLTAWQASLVRRATSMNRDRDFEGLEALWKEQHGPFMEYAGMRPELGEFRSVLTSLRTSSARPMSERAMKQAYDTASSLARARRMHYWRAKGTLKEQIEDWK